jgi:hypothetical protein
MAAAWSFSRGGPQSPGSISRLVSTLSLDGDRISADLIVHFARALSVATTESIADEYARAATEILGEQISQGEVPLSKEELVRRVQAKVSASAAKVAQLEVRGLYLYGSEATNARSTYRSRPVSPPPPFVKGHGSGAMPAVRQSSTFHSPVLTPPPAPRARTLWPQALVSCRPGMPADQIGKVLGAALRDSAAAAVLNAFVAVDPQAADRMALFQSGSVVREIVLEVCGCFGSALYRIFLAHEVDQRVASEIVQAACVHAAEEFPATQIADYMASGAPVRDLANRMAASIGAPETAPLVLGAIAPYCEALREDVAAAAEQVRRIVA